QENDERGSLRGNHEAKVACGSRQVEYRPGERERRDRIAEQRHQLSSEEQPKLALLERAEGDPPHLGPLSGVHQPWQVDRRARRVLTADTGLLPRCPAAVRFPPACPVGGERRTWSHGPT